MTSDMSCKSCISQGRTSTAGAVINADHVSDVFYGLGNVCGA